ncbi:hypothetical protein [Candidatus Methanodesulfokora washburnensis]|nr:hypothetical protein [Candidatus Methanodesulfokores washburnensis]
MKKGISKFFRKLKRAIRRFFRRKILRKGVKRTYTDAERLAWYIYKFSSSCGAFKENPTKENLEMLKKTTTQLNERLGIELNGILEIAEKYLQNPCTDLKISLNEKARDLIMEIMEKGLVKEEEIEEGDD